MPLRCKNLVIHGRNHTTVIQKLGYISKRAMASVLSTVLSRLNAFLDTELEQTICFDSAMDAESFASRKSAIQNRYWTGPEQGQDEKQESQKQSRPSQKGRSAQRHTGDTKQEVQLNPPLVTSFGFEKKQDTPPTTPDRR